MPADVILLVPKCDCIAGLGPMQGGLQPIRVQLLLNSEGDELGLLAFNIILLKSVAGETQVEGRRTTGSLCKQKGEHTSRRTRQPTGEIVECSVLC